MALAGLLSQYGLGKEILSLLDQFAHCCEQGKQSAKVEQNMLVAASVSE